MQTRKVFDSFFEKDNLISEYIESKFQLFCVLCVANFNVKVAFLKNWSHFWEERFYLKFAKKVKCIHKT